MGKHKILFITSRLAIGGEELSTLTIAKELKKRGHDVSWMSTAGPILSEIEENHISFVKAPVNGRGVLSILQGAMHIHRFLRQVDIDIVHSQSVYPALMSFFACLFSSKNYVPRIIWHDRGIHEYSYRIVAHLFNYMMDFIITNSQYEKELLIRQGLKPQKVRAIHNCLNTVFPINVHFDINVARWLGITKENFVIGTVRRLHPKKGGYYELLEAMAIILKEEAKAKLLIVGDGPLREKLQKRTLELGIASRTIFAGLRRDLEKIYPLMDVFVLPSTYEPFGNVLIEAMSFGIPVVATNVGGIPEIIIDGVTGFLVPPREPNNLAEKILYLLESRDVAKKMGKLGKENVKKYFIAKRLGDEIEEVYDYLSSK